MGARQRGKYRIRHARGAGMNAKFLSNVAYGLLAVGLLWYVTRQRQPASGINPGTSEGGIFTLPAFAAALTNKGAGPVRQITPETLAFIRAREGYRETPYPDAAGYSIGYGHFLGVNPIPARITRQQAEDWLLQDATKAAKEIYSRVTVPLTQGQFDALVSFVFNVGGNNFAGSTLLRKINAGDYAGAAAEFRRWIFSGGTAVAGLTTRRAAERDLFIT